MSETRKRVKVYMLNSERQWEDKGTGCVSTPYVKQLKGISLTVISELDGSQLLQVKIQSNVAYQKQQDTLIVWSEDKDIDLALSFQEKTSCEEVWKLICELQGKDSSVDITQEIVEESEDENYGFLSDSFAQIDLPLCELCSLKEINEIISTNMHSPVRREKLATIIENDGYVEKLLTVFHECEDLEYTEGLHYLNEIFKNMFLLNKSGICEEMLQESNILDVIGCLEYDPSSPTPRKYRKNLKDLANYKEVIQINNAELISKIHQTYRIQYIQDIILPIPPITENNMFSALSSIILVNKVEIVSCIQDDENILHELFSLLNDSTTDKLKRRDLIRFLRELFIFAQCLQTTEKETFCKKLSSMGIFQTFELHLGTNDTHSRAALVDILNCYVEFSPSIVREYILTNISGNRDDTFMNVLISLIINDTDPELGGASQMFCILKTLLDPENMLMSSCQSEKSDFLKYFYNSNANILLAPLLINTEIDTPFKSDYQTQQLLGFIVDFLAYCVDNHTYHVQNYIIENDLLSKTSILLKSEHKFVVLGAIKFMRKIIGQLDEGYANYIIKRNLFAPIVQLLTKIQRMNILRSAILEMFHFINTECTRIICIHIIDNFWDVLKDVDHTNIFRSLKSRVDAYKDTSKGKENVSPRTARHVRYRRDERDLEEEEEKWFEEDDLEESIPAEKEVKQTSESEPMSKDSSVNACNVASSGSPSSQVFPTKGTNRMKSCIVAVTKVMSCKRALVDYEGDSDEEDDITPPPAKRAKQS